MYLLGLIKGGLNKPLFTCLDNWQIHKIETLEDG